MKDVRVSKSKIRVGFKGYVSTTDDGVLDMAYTDKAYNFAFEKGVLTGGIGIDPAFGNYISPPTRKHIYPEMPSGKKIKDVFLYRRVKQDGAHDDRLIAQLTDGQFYYTSMYTLDTWHAIDTFIISADVTAVNYNFKGKDMMLFATGRNLLLILDDTTPYVITNTPEFTSLAVHNERIYAGVNGTNNQVWFSDDFNPTNWNVSADEGGYINFSDECGEVLRVVSFLNYLYIFREYGIFRLTAYGDQNEFLLKKVFTDTGRIVKNSIEVCGDKIIFYAEDGLFAFDGYEVVRIAKELVPINKTYLMSGAYLDGCYYLACCIWENSSANNAVVRYSFLDKSISVLYGYAVKSLKAIRIHNCSQVLCVFAKGDDMNKLGVLSKSGKVMGNPTKKRYISPYGTLFSSSLKTVRNVSLVTSTPLTLTVKLDGKQYDYKVNGSEYMQTIPIERSGCRVGFELSCESADAYVTPLGVSIDKISI